MAKPRSKKKAKPRKSSRTSATKPPKGAATLIVRLNPRDGQEMLLEAELRALVGPTRKEEGCLTYDLYRSAELPIAFMLHEVWASREHHARHTNTPHFLRWNARKDALLSSRDSMFWKQVL